jgi:hypothetical protein
MPTNAFVGSGVDAWRRDFYGPGDPALVAFVILALALLASTALAGGKDAEEVECPERRASHHPAMSSTAPPAQRRRRRAGGAVGPDRAHDRPTRAITSCTY